MTEPVEWTRDAAGDTVVAVNGGYYSLSFTKNYPTSKFDSADRYWVRFYVNDAIGEYKSMCLTDSQMLAIIAWYKDQIEGDIV